MAHTCMNHGYEQAVGQCPDCSGSFCEKCMVPPVSKRQTPRCVSCALVAAGVRTRRTRVKV